MSQPCADLGEECSRQREQQIHGTQSEREHLRNGPMWLEQSEQRGNDTKFDQSRLC